MSVVTEMVWKRLQYSVLDPASREIHFLILHNIIANKDRMHSTWQLLQIVCHLVLFVFVVVWCLSLLSTIVACCLLPVGLDYIFPVFLPSQTIKRLVSYP